MLLRAVLALLAVSLCACKPPEGSHPKAIIGALLMDGAGGPPLSDSVVVVGDDRIRAAGARSNVEIPAEADKIDGSGKFVVPLLVDICDSAAPAGLIHPANPEEARAQVADAAARKVCGHSPGRDRSGDRGGGAGGCPRRGHSSDRPRFHAGRRAIAGK